MRDLRYSDVKGIAESIQIESHRAQIQFQFCWTPDPKITKENKCIENVLKKINMDLRKQHLWLSGKSTGFSIICWKYFS